MDADHLDGLSLARATMPPAYALGWLSCQTGRRRTARLLQRMRLGVLYKSDRTSECRSICQSQLLIVY